MDTTPDVVKLITIVRKVLCYPKISISENCQTNRYRVIAFPTHIHLYTYTPIHLYIYTLIHMKYEIFIEETEENAVSSA